MPCFEQSPFIAEWEGVSSEGEWVLRELRPDDLLVDISQGCSPEELAEKHKAPLDAIEHAICHIPHMMAWRREQVQQQSRLPSIQQDQKTAEDYEMGPAQAASHPSPPSLPNAKGSPS